MTVSLCGAGILGAGFIEVIERRKRAPAGRQDQLLFSDRGGDDNGMVMVIPPRVNINFNTRNLRFSLAADSPLARPLALWRAVAGEQEHLDFEQVHSHQDRVEARASLGAARRPGTTRRGRAVCVVCGEGGGSVCVYV